MMRWCECERVCVYIYLPIDLPVESIISQGHGALFLVVLAAGFP